MAEAGGEKLRRKAFGERMKNIPIFVLFGLVLFFATVGFFSKKVLAATAPNIITYQGKLLRDGLLQVNAVDIKFLLYDDLIGGSILYTASGTVGVPEALSITPSQGLFSINLGDTNTNPINPAIFQNNNSVYLEVVVAGEVLSPRKRITAVPYAFNSKYLDGVGINTLSSTQYIPVSDASGNFIFNSTTITTSTISNLVAGFTTTTNLYVSGLANFANSTTMQTTTITGGFYQSGLADCSGEGQTLNYDLALGKFTCLADGAGGGGGSSGAVGTSTVNYFAFYDSANSVTGTPLMQFTNGAISFTTNTSFSLVSSTNGLFGSVTTTNLSVSGALFLPANSITDGMVINGLTIDGGEINNTPIGGANPSTGVFTNLTSSIFFATDTLFVSASTTNLYVSGSLNLPNNSITNAMVADNITASNYLLLTGGSLSGQLIFTSASGTAITSTNIVSTNLNAVNVTSTNLYVSATTSIATTSVLRTLNIGGSIAADYYFSNANANAFFSGDSGGIVFNGGYLFAAGAGTGLYVANGAVFRGGLSNDSGASLVINGGTSGNTLINNTLTFNNATGTSITSTNIYNNGGFFQTGLGDCDLDTQTVNYDIATGKFSCLADATGAGGGSGVVGTSTVNYFAFYDSANTVTGTPLMQLVNGAITFTTNTSFLFVSSSNALFYNASTTNFAVIGSASFRTTTISGQLTFETASGTSITSTNIVVTNKVGIGTSTPTQALSVVGNISNIIDSNTLITEVGTVAVGSGPNSIFVSGRYAYATNRSADSISVVDISNPSAPIQVGTVSVESNPYSIFVSGRYAYVANRGSGTVSVVDISNPSTPVQVSTVPVESGPQSIFVSGRYAYVANSLSDSISVIDISNPLVPEQIATTSAELTPKSIFVSGRYAYTANSGGSISVIDISNPSNPVQIATTTVGDIDQSLGPNSIFVSGRYAYTVNSNDTFSVIDIADPSAPLEVATTTVGAGTQSLYVSGRYAYVANNSDNNISVVDISRPLSPTQVAISGLVAGGPTSIYVSGRYTYTTNLDDTISVIDISGTEVSSLIAGSAEVGNFQSRNDIFAQGNIMAGTSLIVGAGGIYSQGGLSVFSSSTGVTSSIFNVGSSGASSTLRVFANGTIVLATTTINGLLTFNSAVGVSLTSTNLYIASLANFAGSLVFVNASGTSITSTNAFFPNLLATSITSTNLFATSSVFVNTNILNATSTNLYISNLSNFAGLLTFTTASGTSITSTNAFFTNLSATNFNPSNIIATSITSTNLFATTSVFNTTTINNKLSIGTTTFNKALTVVGSISNVLDVGSDISLVTSSGVGGSILQSIFVSGRYAYMTNQTAKTLTIVDITNPSLPVFVGTSSLSIATGGPGEVVVSGRYAYVSNPSNNSLSVVDVSNPASPREIATTTVSGGGPVAVSGRYAYLVNGTVSRLTVVDISIPSSPRQIATLNGLGNTTSGIYISGRYAYVSNTNGKTVAVIDISDPSSPSVVGSGSVSGIAADIFVSGRYAYTANSTSNTISVVNISNPASPVEVGTTTIVGNPVDIFVSGRYAFTANSTSNTISVIDVSVPSSPTLIKNIAVGTGPNSVFVSGRYAYITNANSANFSIVDISGTEVTSLIAHSAEAGQLQVRNDIFAQGSIMAGTSLSVGAGGISSHGGLSVFSSSTGITTTIFSVGSKNSTTTLRVFADGTVILGTTTMNGLFTFGNATGTSITSTNARFTTLNFTNATGTSITSTNAFLSSLNFTSASGTMITSTNLFVSSKIGINSSSPDASLTIQGVGGTNPLNIVSSTGASMFTILQNGNIGIGTSTPGQKLSVIGNISNIIDSGTTMSQVSAIAIGQPNSVFVSGRYAYVPGFTANKLSIVDVSNPSVPAIVGNIALSFGPAKVFVSGRYAYLVDAFTGVLAVVDISNPSAPVLVSTKTLSSYTSSIYVSGKYLYAAQDSSADQVEVLDISNPFSVVSVATTSVGDSPSSIYVSGRYAYVANSGVNTISVVDISNPTLPVQIATTSVGSNPQSVFVSGRYAYVANKNANTISVVDISNASVPTVVGTVTVGAGPWSIYVSGRYLFSANSDDDNISVVDISSSTAPTAITTVSVGNDPRSIFVSGRYAYITNALSETMSIVDISGTEVSSLMAHSAEVGQLQVRNDIFVQGNFMAGGSLSVGVGGIFSQGSLAVFTSSTGPTSSVFSVASKESPNALRILSNGNVGIGTSTPTQKLSVVGNISNIIDSGTTISQISTVSVGAMPWSIFVSGRYAYVSNFSSNTISIVDISNPSAPTQVATTSVGVGPEGIFVSGRYAYVSNFSSGTVSIIDVSNPSSPVQVATTSAVSSASSVVVSGKYMYVNNGNAVRVFDISNPQVPVEVTNFSVGTLARALYVSGRYLYVANFNSNDLSVVDISNPSAPTQIATVSVGGNPFSVSVSGRYAYVANNASGTISIVDISNPNTPLQVATTSVGGNPSSLFLSGRYLFVTNEADDNLSVVDVSIPLSPSKIMNISVGDAPKSVFVSGRYAYITNSGSNNISVVDISGTEVSSLIAGSAEVGNIQSRNDIFAQGNIMAGTSLTVGVGGISSQGSLSIFASSTGATSSIFNISSAVSSTIFNVFANGRIGIGTASFSGPTSTLDVQGQIEVNLSSPAGATFALCHTSGGAANNEVIYDCSGAPTADYMEMYPSELGLELGDVVVFSNNFVNTSDGNTVPKLTKATATYQTGLVGIISDKNLAGDFNSIGHNVAESDNPLPLALSGRVLIKVTNINGDIHVGDKLTSSGIPGVAMKATEDGPTIAIAMGDYTSAQVGKVLGFVNTSINSVLQQALTLDTSSKTITVGKANDPYDLVVTGNIILNQNNLINKLSFATSTLFESSVENFAGARAFTFNAIGFINSSADNYILSLRANNNSVFSVASNGDVHALGNYYGASAVLGTSTNPGDLAERVDIAIDDNAEAGDVMMVDRNAPDTYRRSDSAYEQSVAGVISTNPTIVVGNGRTDYTAVLAMVGRVPIKVSDENGAISRGDLLVSASRLGYAMKYDPTKDKNNKVVGIIGMALEPLPASSTGKILALIRTGWVYNRDEDIKKLKNNIEQVAMSQGINLDPENNPDNLNVLNNNNNQLVYSNGNLNLLNNSLINVASIIGNNNKWRIDEFGNLVQKIATAVGDKEIYGLQSSVQREIVISGTSTLENGSKRVMLTDLDQAIIDRTVPLKIMITPSGETFGVYVAERSYDNFLVKENGNGVSNAEFDWTVIAKVLVLEDVVVPPIVIEPSSTVQAPPIENGGGQEIVNPPEETPVPPISNDVTSPSAVVEPVVYPVENVVVDPPQEVPANPAP